MVTANIGVSSYTTCWTSSLFENNGGYQLREKSRTNERKTPAKREVMEAIITENFAVLGCPAPSSFDTLTLHQMITILRVLLALTTTCELSDSH